MNASLRLTCRQLWLAVSSVSPPAQSSCPRKEEEGFRTGRKVCWQQRSHPGHWQVSNTPTASFTRPASQSAVRTQRELSGYFTVPLMSTDKHALMVCVCVDLCLWTLSGMGYGSYWNAVYVKRRTNRWVSLHFSCLFIYLFGFQAKLAPQTLCTCRTVTWHQCDTKSISSAEIPVPQWFISSAC